MRFYIIILLYLKVISCLIVNQKPICCFPNKFETFYFMSQGWSDPGGYGYANATIKTAFDGENQLTYTHEHSQTFMSILPDPFVLNFTDIFDYINKKKYRVYVDGTCDEWYQGEPLYQECIPGNATLINEGLFGQTGQVLKTYLFHDTIYLDLYEVTMTVIMSDDEEGECIPIRISISDSYDSDDNVNIFSADIFDFTIGIKDRSVCTPPSTCVGKTKSKKSRSKNHPGRIRDILWSFAHKNKRT